MTISIYAMSVETFIPILTTLSGVLDKGAEHARTKGQSPDALMDAKLAPDMFPLIFQVQFACHQAVTCAAMLTGKDAAQFEAPEKTFDEAKARLSRALDYLKGLNAAAFEGAENRLIKMPLQDPLELEAHGLQFLRDWTLPNFYFHVVTAYDILRHEGVELGKRDFMGHIGPYLRQRGAA